MATQADSPADTRSDLAAASFEQRWLRMVDVAPDQLADAAGRARARAARYPTPIGALWRVLVWWIDWFAPAVFLVALRRARSLDAERFDRLMRRLRANRLLPIRLLGLLAVAPLMEVVCAPDAPPRPDHPLDARLPQPPALRGRTDYDVIVIGSGAGGAPVACELAGAGRSVCIVDKGGVVHPDDAPKALERHYVNQGLLGPLVGSPIVVVAGSALGGTTPINSGTSLRPRPENLARWDRDWGTAFGDGQLEAYVDRACEAISVMVPPAELRSLSAKTVERGLHALGRTETYGLPRNVAGCAGSGRCCFGCPTGAKQSTDRSFLPRAIDAGAVVLGGHTATDIRERDDRVEVRLRTPGGGERTVSAQRLVLAAGALATPGLIRRNRLGSRRGQAGRYFRTHPATKVFAHLDGLEREPARPGIPQALGYKPPELDRITMEGAEVPLNVTGPMLAAAGERFRWWLRNHDRLVSYGAMIQDRGHGTVSQAFGQPLLRYRVDDDDVRDLVEAMKLIGHAFFAAGADRILLPFLGRDSEYTEPAALDRLDAAEISHKNLMMSGFHPQGTAGIGRVVDDDLRLIGTERIWVCDASVFPDSPGVNPQVTIIALALRLAEHLNTSA